MAASSSTSAEREAFLRPPPAPSSRYKDHQPPSIPLLRINGGNNLTNSSASNSGGNGSGNNSRRTLPNVQSLQPWMLPMTPGFLPSPIHPRKLSLQDRREFFEDDTPHAAEMLRDIAKLATFPAVGG
uniref:Uncharacterized protein n=1 Tax=Panagrolaimus sp. PS1159 TaxID=55785 RepID=A0AC35FCX4_9BILA